MNALRFFDPKAQRAAASAEATVAEAEADALRARAEAEAAADLARAEAIRADTDLRTQERRLDLAARERERAQEAHAKERSDQAAARAQKKIQKRKESLVRWQQRKARMRALAVAVQVRTPDLVGVVAVGSPMFIAWNGQLAFGSEMGLGPASIMLPIALEGGVLYSVYLTDQALRKQLPTGPYRAMTWALAIIAAGMNLWHQIDKHATPAAPWAGLQLGVTFALTSLLTIVLLELKARLKKQVLGKRSITEIRQALWRRVRYPRLSWAAASLQAAQSCTTEQAWQRAWVDRYGVGPEVGRGDRKIAKTIMKVQRKADQEAARAGRLRLINGTVVGRPTARRLAFDWLLLTTPLATVKGPTQTIKISVDRVDAPPRRGAGHPTLALESGPTHSPESGHRRPTERPTERPTRADSVGRASDTAGRGQSDGSDRLARRGADRLVAAESDPRRPTVTVATERRVAPRKSLPEHRQQLQTLIGKGELPSTPTADTIREALSCSMESARILRDELRGGSA